MSGGGASRSEFCMGLRPLPAIAGLAQEQFGAEVGMPRSALRRWRNSRTTRWPLVMWKFEGIAVGYQDERQRLPQSTGCQ